MESRETPRERRQFGRRMTAMHGWVRAKGLPAIACIVRNVSERGALLELSVLVQLPYFFELEIEAIDFRGACEIRHQRDTKVGVFFLDKKIDVRIGHFPKPKPDGEISRKS